MGEQKEKVLQWHPAFFAGIQIEFEDEAQYLEFESEYMLSSKPMQVDVLIIKKDKERQIRKNIGRIFRTYNIVEYKSPEDYLSIDDFFKVYGYTCFYKSDTGRVNEISAEELTITFVCQSYPKKLSRYLITEAHRSITRREPGIYDISDETFLIQLIVQSELSAENNLWLKSLTNRLREKSEINRLLGSYARNEWNSLHQSVMNVVIQANREQLDGGDESMCEALMELMEPYIKREGEKKRLEGELKGKLEGQLTMIDRLVSLQNFSLEKACEIAGITTKEYAELKERFAKEASAQ